MAKLTWGLIGGGEGSQIGPAHRLGARLDGAYDFVAGALDHDPVAGRAYAQRLGVAPDRAYGDWREMLAAEAARPDRLDLVTVATPNSTHFEIAKAFPDVVVAKLNTDKHVTIAKRYDVTSIPCLILFQKALRTSGQ